MFVVYQNVSRVYINQVIIKAWVFLDDGVLYLQSNLSKIVLRNNYIFLIFQIIHCLVQKSFDSFKQATKSETVGNMSTESHISLVRFCDQILHQIETGKVTWITCISQNKIHFLEILHEERSMCIDDYKSFLATTCFNRLRYSFSTTLYSVVHI